MSRHDPATRTGTLLPWWVSVATLPGRVALALTLAVLDPPPSVGVLDRLSRWAPRRRDARGSQCGRR